MIVVKVGGSLFDCPKLRVKLHAYLATLAPEPVLLVAGGGQLADAVRELDRVHAVGEETAHWLALRSLSVTAALLRGFELGAHTTVLDCFAFAETDETREGKLPHSWAVTTDSIAARAAQVFGAHRLILLKSTTIPPATSWELASANGWVDAYFPQIAASLAPACRIDAVNFRALTS
jgi:aspartokinase-like uncharacterized kinase